MGCWQPETHCMRSLLEGCRTQSSQEFFWAQFLLFSSIWHLRGISLIIMEIPGSLCGCLGQLWRKKWGECCGVEGMWFKSRGERPLTPIQEIVSRFPREIGMSGQTQILWGPYSWKCCRLCGLWWGSWRGSCYPDLSSVFHTNRLTIHANVTYYNPLIEEEESQPSGQTYDHPLKRGWPLNLIPEYWLPWFPPYKY